MEIETKPAMTKTTRNGFLDILRGLAIFGVLVFHTSQLANQIVILHKGRPLNIFTDFFNYGAYGVELFFVLSGWLLTSIYSGHRFIGKAYWIRRMAKILPLWGFFFLVQIVYSQFGLHVGWYAARQVSAGQNTFIHSPLGITLTTMTFTLWISSSLWNTVLPGAWSIQAEVGHYLLFPKVMKLSLIKVVLISSIINYLSIALGLFQLSHFYSHTPVVIQQSIEGYLRLNLFTTFDFFLFGIIANRVHSNWRNSENLEKFLNAQRKNGIILILFTISFMLAPLPVGKTVEAVGFIFASLLIAFGISRVSLFQNLFQVMGKLSYFIYFIHFQLLFFLTRWTNHSNFKLDFELSQLVVFFPLLFLTLFFSLILGQISYKYFELPILRKAHNL
jgi:peptidoglycan/LPS O-acetylase OafA/YrhL